MAGLWVVGSSAEVGFILLLTIQEDQQASPSPLKGSPQLPVVEKNAEETMESTLLSAITRTSRKEEGAPSKASKLPM